MPGRLVVSLVAAALLSSGMWADVSVAPLREYELKAGFLYNVLKFVSWPDAAPAVPVLTIAVVAPAPIPEFATTISGRIVKGRTLTVGMHDDAATAGDAAVVFVTADAAGQLPRVLKEVEGRPVLTVAEEGADGSAQAIIALAIAETKLTFDVNLDAAQRARLQLDSNLLALARKVRGGRGTGAR